MGIGRKLSALLASLLVASPAPAETIKVDVWPVTKTISLSTSATISSLPAAGTKNRYTVQHLGDGALTDDFLEYLVSTEGSPGSEIRFESPSVSRSVAALLKQYETLLEAIETSFSEFSGRVRGFDRNTAELDQLSTTVLPPGAEERIGQARLTLVSFLWDETFLQLATRPTDSPSKELPRSLEEGISAKLSRSRVNLAAAVTGLDISELTAAAPRLLADEVRRKKLGSVPTIADPSMPTRTYRINDPNLINVNYKWRGNLEQFEAYLSNYCAVAEPYWQSVIDKQILNKDDLSVLRSWHFIDSKFAMAPAQTPAIYIKTLCEKARNDLLRRKADSEMRREIAQLTAYYWICSASIECEGFSKLPREAKEKTIAWEAAKKIGADPKVVPAHFIDYELMVFLVTKYFGDLVKTNWTNVRAASGDAATARELLSPIIGDYISSEVESTVIATTIDLGPLIEVGPYVFKPWQTPERFSPTVEIPEIIREMLAGSFELDRYLVRIQDWRVNNIDASTVPTGIGYTIERIWRQARNDWEQFNTMRQDTDRAKDVAQAIYALNGALGYTDLLHHWEGRILLPDDTVVEASHVVTGEQVAADQPVLTVANLFSRHGRSFLNGDQISKLGLLPGHAFVVRNPANNLTMPPEIQLLMIVLGVEARRSGEFEVNFELLPAFDTSRIADRPKQISDFLRVQWRFCRKDAEVFDSSNCEVAEKLLPQVASMELVVEREVKN